MIHRRKLIEVAVQLEVINREAAREKSIRHGHPSTLHLWWAWRPLAACRAVQLNEGHEPPKTASAAYPTEVGSPKRHVENQVVAQVGPGSSVR